MKKQQDVVITDFLKTKRSKRELKIALTVLREFKSCESEEEWLYSSFESWEKLEMLEEMLAHLCEKKTLNDDTLKSIAHTQKRRKIKRRHA